MSLDEAVKVIDEYLGIRFFVSKNMTDPVDYGRSFIGVRDKSGRAQIILISSDGELIDNGSWVKVEEFASR